MEVVVEANELSKTYSTPGGVEIAALRSATLHVRRGELVVLLGRSGSGKSTLLNLIAGLDRPTTGRLVVSGAALGALSEDGLAGFRGRHVGVVFQFFQLLPTLSVLENVILPMDLVGSIPRRERTERAQALLRRLDVEDQAAKAPGALSGGQQQRVAIARALANQPSLLVADEPTGNLDSTTARTVAEWMRRLASEGTTVIIATHDEGLAALADRVVRLRDGVSSEEPAS